MARISPKPISVQSGPSFEASVIEFSRNVESILGQLTSDVRLGSAGSPTFSSLTLSDLTASRLLEAGTGGLIQSVLNLTDYISGTANEIEVTNDGDGTVTIGIVDPLIVAKGGTGAATLTDHGILLGSGTGAITPLGVATNGQLPIGSTGADPVLGTITAGTGISVTNGAGTITLDSNDGEIVHNSLSGLQGGTTDEYYHLTSARHTTLVAIGDLATTDSNFIVGNGSTWVAETGDTARTSLGLGTGDSPTLTGLTVSGLTASRLVATGGSSELASVANLASWIAGTANQIIVTDDSDGTITLSTPQDIHTSATPQFAGLGIGEAYDSASLINLGGTVSGASFIFALDFCPTLTSTGNFVYSIYAVPTAVTLPDTKTYTGIALACSSIEFTGGATTGTYQCIYTLGPSSVTGTVSEAIGVFIGAMKQTGVTTGYGIYQTYSSDINYFNGNTGIKEATPAASLEVNGTTRLGDGGSNYSEFESDGTLEFLGNATVWNDANVGAVVLTLPAASRPTETNFLDEAGADTGIATWGYAVGDKSSGSIEIPHDYKEGSDITFHIHWQGIGAPTGTDYVKWQLTYTVAQVEATLDATTTITVETAFDTQYEFKRSDFTAITGTNFNIGDQFLFTIQRVAAAGDAYAGAALVATVGFHYECDTVGSRQIITK